MYGKEKEKREKALKQNLIISFIILMLFCLTSCTELKMIAGATTYAVSSMAEGITSTPEVISVVVQNTTGHEGSIYIRLKSDVVRGPMGDLRLPQATVNYPDTAIIKAGTWTPHTNIGTSVGTGTGFLARLTIRLPEGYTDLFDVLLATDDGRLCFGKNELNPNLPVTLTPQDKFPTLTFQNNSMQHIYVNFPDSGKNPQTNYSFPPGHSQVFQLFESFVHNTHFFQYRIGGPTYSDSDLLYFLDMVVDGNTTYRFPKVSINNNTGNTVNRVHIRHQNLGEWGNNYTSSGIINNDTWSIVFIDFQLNNREKIYDIRLDDVSGNTYVKRGIKISEDIELVFSSADIP